jgi:hypothetical protein
MSHLVPAALIAPVNYSCSHRYPQLLQLLSASQPAAAPSLAPLLSCPHDGSALTAFCPYTCVLQVPSAATAVNSQPASCRAQPSPLASIPPDGFALSTFLPLHCYTAVIPAAVATNSQPEDTTPCAVNSTRLRARMTNGYPCHCLTNCRYPQLLQLLTASLPADPPSLAPLLATPPDGFTGQLARLSVHVEELLLPGGDDVLLERPKIANYVAAYRLPGARTCWCAV